MNFTKGVGIFIIQDNKILLLKRKTEPFKNCWEVPAGKVDGSEVFQETVVRETKEETNLIVKPVKEIGVNVNKENNFESHMFTAEVVEGDLKNNEPEKHSDIKYFPLDYLPQNLGSTTKKGLQLLNS